MPPQCTGQPVFSDFPTALISYQDFFVINKHCLIAVPVCEGKSNQYGGIKKIKILKCDQKSDLFSLLISKLSIIQNNNLVLHCIKHHYQNHLPKSHNSLNWNFISKDNYFCF